MTLQTQSPFQKPTAPAMAELEPMISSEDSERWYAYAAVPDGAAVRPEAQVARNNAGAFHTPPASSAYAPGLVGRNDRMRELLLHETSSSR